ncbi:MAG: SRPBCC family protein [Anaerolineaceae bacterium]|nr:SRPBCC family protein [Anaerolineaceae bacterium]
MPVTHEYIDIACTREAAFDFIADPKKQADMNPSAREIRDFQGGQPKVGDHWTVIFDFMGREIISTYTLIESSPPLRLIYTHTSNSADIRIVWTFESALIGTRVTYYSNGQPKGFFSTLALNLVKGNFDSNVRNSLITLKNHLEVPATT